MNRQVPAKGRAAVSAFPCLPGCPFQGISYCLECHAGYYNLQQFGHVDGREAASLVASTDLERALLAGAKRRTHHD